MPELPEVEVIRLGLIDQVKMCRIADTHVLHPRLVRSHIAGPEGFAADVTGSLITDVRRRGKFLWFVLDDAHALIAHLGMSGQFRINAPQDEQHRHTRVIFDLTDGRQLRYIDQRMFGGFTFLAGAADEPVTHIGRDLFDPQIDLSALATRMRSRRSAIKRVLLDQKLVSGIGNIYADEALWAEKIHPETPAGSLSQRKTMALLRAAREVMESALAQGGTSFDELYVNVNGDSGYFVRSLNAYGREHQPCRRCGKTMVRKQFMNRSSCYCPHCQRPRTRISQ